MNKDFKAGDYLVCVQKNWTTFKYGKKYELISPFSIEKSIVTNLVPIVNENRELTYPTYITEGEVNFVTLAEWRDLQIDKILKLQRVEDLIQEVSVEKLLGTDYYNQNEERLDRLSNRLQKLQTIKDKLLSL